MLCIIVSMVLYIKRDFKYSLYLKYMSLSVIFWYLKMNQKGGVGQRAPRTQRNVGEMQSWSLNTKIICALSVDEFFCFVLFFFRASGAQLLKVLMAAVFCFLLILGRISNPELCDLKFVFVGSYSMLSGVKSTASQAVLYSPKGS